MNITLKQGLLLKGVWHEPNTQVDVDPNKAKQLVKDKIAEFALMDQVLTVPASMESNKQVLVKPRRKK